MNQPLQTENTAGRPLLKRLALRVYRPIDRLLSRIDKKWERPWLQYMSDMGTVVAYAAAGAIITRHSEWAFHSKSLAIIFGVVLYVMALVGSSAAGSQLIDAIPGPVRGRGWRGYALGLSIIISLCAGNAVAMLVARALPG